MIIFRIITRLLPYSYSESNFDTTWNLILKKPFCLIYNCRFQAIVNMLFNVLLNDKLITTSCFLVQSISSPQ